MQTALHFACRNGNLDIVRMMLQQPGVSASHTDRFGETSLHYACCSFHPGALRIAKLLVEMKVPINQTSSTGRTPLNLALKCHNFDIASMLVAEGCDPAGWVAPSNFRDIHHVFARLPILTASSQTELVQRVVNAGVDVDIPCCIPFLRVERTPVFVAASSLNAACMKALLQGGAKLNSVVIDWWQRGHYRTRTTFLVGLFCLLFGKPRHRPLMTKNLGKTEAVIVLALEFGASLERLPSPHSDLISALEYGVLVAEDGDTALLELLLKRSTARNAKRSFVTRLIRSSGNESIREMLVDFKARQLS
jgi:ankyrin repeat protein